MAELDRQKALDHVVVVMFEDRSFDHLLGRLYQPAEVGSFEGVIGKDLSRAASARFQSIRGAARRAALTPSPSRDYGIPGTSQAARPNRAGDRGPREAQGGRGD